ncbi:MAG: hypothetical protein WKH64_17985 [Chloroflexia bacterium]
MLFGYEVCFEAYVVPEKRRYGCYASRSYTGARLWGEWTFGWRETRSAARARSLPGAGSRAHSRPDRRRRRLAP